MNRLWEGEGRKKGRFEERGRGIREEWGEMEGKQGRERGEGKRGRPGKKSLKEGDGGVGEREDRVGYSLTWLRYSSADSRPHPIHLPLLGVFLSLPIRSRRYPATPGQLNQLKKDRVKNKSRERDEEREKRAVSAVCGGGGAMRGRGRCVCEGEGGEGRERRNGVKDGEKWLVDGE